MGYRWLKRIGDRQSQYWSAVGHEVFGLQLAALAMSRLWLLCPCPLFSVHTYTREQKYKNASASAFCSLKHSYSNNFATLYNGASLPFLLPSLPGSPSPGLLAASFDLSERDLRLDDVMLAASRTGPTVLQRDLHVPPSQKHGISESKLISPFSRLDVEKNNLPLSHLVLIAD